MPANLPAEAKHKWREASEARKPEEKIEKLQEFLSLVPKHKGTEKLRAQVKRKIAILRREIAEKKRKKAGVSGPKFFIEKEGDFYKQFSYAKVWSKRLRFSPQKVGGTFTLQDGDTVEIHMK